MTQVLHLISCQEVPMIMGEKVKFTGEVLQVTELTDEVQMRLATEKSRWGEYNDDVICIFLITL